MSLAFKTKVVREVPGMIVSWYGGACPWQAEGTFFGRPFYARFRGDSASLAIYESEDDRTAVQSSIIDGYTGEPYAGDLNEDQALQMIKDLVLRLAPVSEDNPTSAQRIGKWIEKLREEYEL